MNIHDAFPSKYVKASDLKDREIELVIHVVTLEDVGDDGRKPVVYFDGVKKGLLLNKTNAGTIAATYGFETDNWTSRPIVLFPTTCQYRGDTVDCIRLRIPQIEPVTVIEAVRPAADPFVTSGNGRESVIQL